MRTALQIALTLAVVAAGVWVSAKFVNSSAEAAAGTVSHDQLRKQIVSALSQRLGTLQITYTGNQTTMKAEILDLLDSAVRSDDYLHYIVKKYGYNASIRGNKATVTFSFTYWETLAQTTEVKTRIAAALKRIIVPGMNDHQKEKAIHDWIVTNVAYDTRLVSYSAYDGIVKGKTVCQGYALLTYEMMRQAGIPVKIVEGTSRGIAHTWNLVQIGGKWYQLDTTWDDPIPDVKGRTTYNYYNLTDAQLMPDHKWKPQTAYPAAVTPYDQTLTALISKDAARKTFYQQMFKELGFLYLTDAYTATSVKELNGKIRTATSLGLKELVIRYTGGVTYRTDLKKAFADIDGLSGYSYTAEDLPRTSANDKLLRITFKYS
ncbi:transglutaminase [Cohnella endophytica]|uniref:Transglutaminase n=1 Tax=Cohnella endophytica TaxID=2419778 RepID=A0A494XGY7_9BACL|nr:transglutaminase domain-containing protein [Cohnella endophytica]RKP50007.1 transglutaminase [Cohnella endophytica]